MSDETLETNNHRADWIDTENEDQARQLIFETKDLHEEVVDVPEWGIQVRVIALTGEERASIMKNCTNLKTGEFDIVRAYPDIVILCTRHLKTGKCIFKPTDRQALLKKASGPLDRLALKAMTLSGMTEEAREMIAKN